MANYLTFVTVGGYRVRSIGEVPQSLAYYAEGLDVDDQPSCDKFFGRYTNWLMTNFNEKVSQEHYYDILDAFMLYKVKIIEVEYI